MSWRLVPLVVRPPEVPSRPETSLRRNRRLATLVSAHSVLWLGLAVMAVVGAPPSSENPGLSTRPST